MSSGRSGSTTLMSKTIELNTISQNMLRSVVGSDLCNISQSNILLSMFSFERFHEKMSRCFWLIYGLKLYFYIE